MLFPEWIIVAKHLTIHRTAFWLCSTKLNNIKHQIWEGIYRLHNAPVLSIGISFAKPIVFLFTHFLTHKLPPLKST